MTTQSPRGFRRAHGLGNDYLVIDAGTFGLPMTAARARRLCDRNRGVGSDGVLVAVPAPSDCDAALRIFNPDGSEAEKSGNGVRIFAAWCYARGATTARALRISTPGGLVTAEFIAPHQASSIGELDAAPRGVRLRVSMGRVSYAMRELPMLRPGGEAAAEGETWIDRELEVAGRCVRATCLSVGNPHAVLRTVACDAETLAALGPLVERHAQFPRRTNVQLCEVLDRRRVRALIWERGAGPTLASGSSACAVVAACAQAGLVDRGVDVEVLMPGGSLAVQIDAEDRIEQTGPVEVICDGVVADDLWAELVRIA